MQPDQSYINSKMTALAFRLQIDCKVQGRNHFNDKYDLDTLRVSLEETQ